MKRPIAILSAFTLLSAFSLRADTIAQWTFETSPPALNDSTSIGGIAADVGSGTASGLHANAATDWSNPAGNGSLESLSANTWEIGDYFQFQVSTIGFSGIGLSFDQTSSNTGPRDYELLYSTDGNSFLSFATYAVLANDVPNPVWNATTPAAVHSYLFDLSSISAIDNQATVFFRLSNISTVSANGGTVASAGSDRIDNFTVLSPVPEPSTGLLAIVGGCLFGWTVIRRKR